MKNGIRITSDVKLKAGNEMLDEHAHEVGAAAPSENLGGEVIFMAIERSTRAWEKERELRA